MKIRVEKVDVTRVLPFRELYRHEANCQIIHDSHLSRGSSDPFLILIEDRVAGYGAVFTKYYPGRVMEFYTFPQFRQHALPMFEELLAVSAATEIEAQTNMPLALSMLQQCAKDIVAEAILFHDATTSYLQCDGLVRERKPEDKIANGGEPEGDWVLEEGGEVVANGGYLTHYNLPYGDIYMETPESHRQKGYGSFLVQELKRICYENGKKPAARCNPNNTASRKTLERAGFQVVGELLAGQVNIQ